MDNVKAGTIARTIVLAIALINQLLVSTGHVPIGIGEDDIYQIVSTTFTICAATIAWWKNNSFTKTAIEADRFMKNLKENI